MFTLLNAIASIASLAVVVPTVQAHMSMWHPSMYGFGDSYEPVTPLANKAFNQWWFHGFLSQKPSEVMSITPGRDLNIQIACSKSYSTWGNSPSSDACPADAGSYHAGGSTGSGTGWSGNSESMLTGCALAIAFKSNANDVKPEDFTVMSIQERCVRQRDTSFSIPANLPSCPNGECTCAWFWQGQNSAEEMYMIGFRCKVENGVATTSYPKPAAPKRGAINGATQPMYWANSNPNIGYTPSWETRPSYNKAYGWTNGAQTSAFGASSGTSNTGSSNSTSNGNTSGNTNGNNASASPSNAATTSSRRRPNGGANSSTAGASSTIGNEYLAQDPAGTTAASTTTTAAAAAQTTAAPTGGSGKKGHCKRGIRRSRSHA